MVISYTNIIEAILTEVDTLLKTYAFDGYTALADYVRVPLGVAVVLYFVCFGVGMTQGWVKGSLSEHAKSCLRIGLIYTIGLHWSFFSEYAYNVFYEASGHIGDVLVGASPVPLPTIGGEGINGALQSILIEVWKISQWILDGGSFTNLGPFVGGLLVGVVGCLLVALAVLETVVAKCMLSILFVTAPLFIAFTLFKCTHTFFDRWLGACVGYACLMIFICAGLGIIVSLDQWILADYYVVKAAEMHWVDMGTAILVSLVCIGLLKRIAGLAMSIGGSVTTVSGHEVLAGVVGGFVGGSMVSGKAVVGTALGAAKGVVGGMVNSVMRDLRSGTPRQPKPQKESQTKKNNTLQG